MGGSDGEFGEGFGGFDLVEFLEVAAADVGLVAGAGDKDSGPGVDGAIREAGEAVDAAGAGDGEENAGARCEVAVGGGGVARGLLIVEGDEADPEGDGAVGQRRHRNSHHAEHVAHAEANQRLGGENVAVNLHRR